MKFSIFFKKISLLICEQKIVQNRFEVTSSRWYKCVWLKQKLQFSDVEEIVQQILIQIFKRQSPHFLDLKSNWRNYFPISSSKTWNRKTKMHPKSICTSSGGRFNRKLFIPWCLYKVLVTAFFFQSNLILKWTYEQKCKKIFLLHHLYYFIDPYQLIKKIVINV
jgi:hypothetical protein